MKSEEFNKNYSIDTTVKRGIKAVSKTASGGYPERMTADNQVFNSENKYYFFDESTRAVRETMGLRRICADWIGGFGLRIVEIEKLRANRNDALNDGQEFFRARIDSLQDLIHRFETEKAND